MSSIDTLSASLREKVGTNSAKKFRISNKIPAIIYGDGKNPELWVFTITINYCRYLIRNSKFFCTISSNFFSQRGT